MNFLVTGANGFVGSHLVEKLLDRGHTVIGTIIGEHGTLFKDKVIYRYMNLINHQSIEDIFNNYQFDGIFHLAAFTDIPSSFETPLLAFQTTALGTAKIVDEIIKTQDENCWLLVSSSPEVYGRGIGTKKMGETTPYAPINPYASAKLAADLYVLERTNSTHLKSFLTRAFLTIGPRRPSRFAISSDARQIARIIIGKQEPVIKIGNLESQRVIIDVRDIVEVYYRLMMCATKNKIKKGDIFHIAGNDLHTIQFYLDRMLDIFGVEAKTEIDPKLFRKIDIPTQIPDDSKVRKFLKWKPIYDVDTTLKNIVNYWVVEEAEDEH